MNLKSKTALILGGTGSIGRVIAGVFENNGITVVRHSSTKVDVSDTNALKNFIEKTIVEHKKIDILVNSVSPKVNLDPFEQKNWDDFKLHLETQLKSAVESAKIVLPLMKQNKYGRIIHIATIYTLKEIPVRVVDYVTAKFALIGFTKALAKETKRFGITVNAVSPSFIKNKFNEKLPDKIVEIIGKESPTGKLITEEDVAKKVLYLVSSEADNITGENLSVTA